MAKTYKLNEEKLDKDYYLHDRPARFIVQDLVTTGFLEEIKKPDWKPRYKDKYFVFDGYGDVAEGWYNDAVWDGKRFDFGNYFKTRELAEEAAEKIKQLLSECKHS